MDLKTTIGFDLENAFLTTEEKCLRESVNLKLVALGHSPSSTSDKLSTLEIARSLLSSYQEKSRLLSSYEYLCPTDQRIQHFLDDYFGDLSLKESIRLPYHTFILDRYGLANVLSLPEKSDSFQSEIVASYRGANGVIHNPKHDRRTTQGVFHVTEEGLPIPYDKKAVPKIAFACILQKALHPPSSLLQLPLTADCPEQAETFVSLLLRPTVCPEVPLFIEKKNMEIRFFAPGNLVSNLDFVESIFGNAGDPNLPENDAGLDPEHWTGHTGCVILAPHVLTLKKKDIGLPHKTEATERQIRDGMCWEDENEKYNDGNPFKITARDERGVIVTVIADNYFGYCKKEVKTQISYSANLYGLCEEEHAGGALVYPCYDLGEDFKLDRLEITYKDFYEKNLQTFEDMINSYQSFMEKKPEGYAVDKKYSNIIYLPQNAFIDLKNQLITWENKGKPQKLPLGLKNAYIFPSGYQVSLMKPTEGQRWRLVGTVAEGTFCHKPCTVSGGGKSEISKALADSIVTGPLYVNDFESDLCKVREIINKEYVNYYQDPALNQREKNRSLLSFERSLGSVIKLLTPSEEYTNIYNAWLEKIPQYIKDFVFAAKRYYKEDWTEKDWKRRFSVDIINGIPGKELRYQEIKIVTNYLRVGFTPEGSWRIFDLRKDFFPSKKILQEDDITASIIVPAKVLEGLNPQYNLPSVKFTENCEYRLFQRPDDAIIPGYDKQAELDISRPNNFFCNYEPITKEKAKEIRRDIIRFEKYTLPMQRRLRDFAKGSHQPDYIVCSAHPRVVDGKPTKNPRYLQSRSDLMDPCSSYLAKVRTRLYRRIPEKEPVPQPVNAVLPGRRNNPPDLKSGIRPLCVFNPIHYMDLPELFMEFIASLTGKSPSTTGAGSEGAMTKGPFNALPPIHDLNNAFLSYVLTGYNGFITAAGYVGPKYDVRHDISLLVPEIWSRMRVEERDPDSLKKRGFLEQCEDFDYKGKTIPFSRLGYRITSRFVRRFCGRIFNNPNSVFTEEILMPEKQDKETFVDGIDNILSAHRRIAEYYFQDHSIELACPPLQALLHIMAYGNYKGKTLSDNVIRSLFTRENVLASEWYAKRLLTWQKKEQKLCLQQIDYLKKFLAKTTHKKEAIKLKIEERLQRLQKYYDTLNQNNYLEGIKGTIGMDPHLFKFEKVIKD